MTNLSSLHPYSNLETIDKLKYFRDFIFGKPRDFWTNYKDQIGQLVKEGKLQPAELNDLPLHQDIETMALLTSSTPKNKRQFFGGMRTPHVHYQGNVYILKEEQWQDFSSKIKDQFIEKLKNANTLSFDQVMELSETIGPMVNQTKV